jgi:tetratricopeptide (TPR) repeat protein
MASESEQCVDLEDLSAFIDGTLEGKELDDVVSHLSRCAKCRLIVERVIELDEEPDEVRVEPLVPHRIEPWKWIAAAAVVLAALFTVQQFRTQVPEARADPIEQMTTKAASNARTVEARMSGGFRWAPFRMLRNADPVQTAPEILEARGAAGDVLRQLKNDDSPQALHAKGVAFLIADRPAEAVRVLKKSAELAPGNARVWSDLAVALYTNAPSDDTAASRAAFDATEQAIRLNPRLTEAYFNRALILERIPGSKEQIRSAWTDYLRHDPSGGWADEARDRLAHYPETK